MTPSIENNPVSLVIAPVTNALSVGVSKVTFTNGSMVLLLASLTVPDSVTLLVCAKVVMPVKTSRIKKNSLMGINSWFVAKY